MIGDSLAWGLPQVAPFQGQVPLASSREERGSLLTPWEGLLPCGVLVSTKARSLGGGGISAPAGGGQKGVGGVFPC